MRLLATTGDFNELAVGVFACVLAVTLLITRWAAKRTHSDTEFYAAGRGVSGTAINEGREVPICRILDIVIPSIESPRIGSRVGGVVKQVVKLMAAAALGATAT